jgi:hypothetical protein
MNEKINITEDEIMIEIRKILNDYSSFREIIMKNRDIVRDDIMKLAYDLVNNKVYKVDLQKKVKNLARDIAINNIIYTKSKFNL